MKTFTIDENNNITAFANQEEAAGDAGLTFSSQKELAKISAEWPIGRFIETWNGFAGVPPFGELKPIKKFIDRKTAVACIWQAIQRLETAATPASVPEQEVKAEPEVVPAPPEIAPEPVAEIPTQEAAAMAPSKPAAAAEMQSVPESVSTAELALVASQVPDNALVEAAANTEAAPADNAPVAEPPAPKPPKRKKAPKPEPKAEADASRARGARPLRWSRCPNARAAPPSPRS